VRGKDDDDKKDAQTRILEAVAKKQDKGRKAYAGGKTLIVFMFSGSDGARWWPNRVARALPAHDFETVWVVVFQYFLGGDRVYAVTRLEANGSPTWWVRIAADFKSWTVSERPPPGAPDAT
jgi:hypothetical protein